MIRNPDENLPEYDLCIVGSGPSGLCVATELSATGLRICVVESGEERRSAFADGLKKVQHQGLSIREGSRERIMGGSSHTWGGQSALLDPIDFEKRSYLKGNEGWIVSQEELAPHLERAAQRYLFPKPELFGTNNFLTGERVPWRDLEPKVFLAYRPRLHFGEEYRYIFNHPSVDLLLGATVTQLIAVKKGDKCTVQEAVIKTPLKSFRVRARAFVLAAGAIENARLLLNSKLGNEHDQVGRYLMDHPKGYIGRVQLSRPLPGDYFEHSTPHRFVSGYMGLRLREDIQRKDNLLNSYIRLEPDFLWVGSKEIATVHQALASLRKRYFREFLRILPRAILSLPRFVILSATRLSRGRSPRPMFLKVRYFLEMEPQAENRVTLDAKRDVLGTPLPHVFHALSKEDIKSFRALQKTLQEELTRLGMGELVLDAEEKGKLPQEDASHHLGTTRMGLDPKTSVVDKNLKVHSVDNLYVAGGSVFPSSGNANPTMVMVALSLRLAQHLRDELRASSLPPVSAAALPVLIIGAGKRVREDILPVLESLDNFAVAGIFARRPRALFGKRAVYAVSKLSALRAEDVAKARIIYISVPVREVAEIISTLLEYDCAHIDLILPTPVIGDILKRGFKNIFVEEDSVFLPWLSLVPRPLKRITFDRSGFRYHAIALVKKLCGGRVRFGIKIGRSLWLWCNGVRVRIIEPRDYAAGHLYLVAEKKVITDMPIESLPSLIREEAELLGPMGRGGTVVTRMHDCKRVGLRRLLQALLRGEGWPLEEGQNDTQIDTALHRFGIYADF